jgi:D-serine deaminase-like pyridoxal phosphate-dependent protein
VQHPAVNEVRPGNYVFFDNIQVANGTAEAGNCALRIVARIIGRYPGRLVIDAGSKALGLDRGAHGTSSVNGYGYLESFPGLLISRLSEEHGIIEFGCNENPEAEIGDIVMIIPNHSCAAANLFSFYQVWNGERLIQPWTVAGRR